MKIDRGIIFNDQIGVSYTSFDNQPILGLDRLSQLITHFYSISGKSIHYGDYDFEIRNFSFLYIGDPLLANLKMVKEDLTILNMGEVRFMHGITRSAFIKTMLEEYHNKFDKNRIWERVLKFQAEQIENEIEALDKRREQLFLKKEKFQKLF